VVDKSVVEMSTPQSDSYRSSHRDEWFLRAFAHISTPRSAVRWEDNELGAQTERPGALGPVRTLLGGATSPAGFSTIASSAVPNSEASTPFFALSVLPQAPLGSVWQAGGIRLRPFFVPCLSSSRCSRTR
jgi:hypothetical protein